MRNHESCDTFRYSVRAGEPCSKVGHGGADVPLVAYYQGKGKDGKATYFSRRVKVFKDLAENASHELKERDRVAVLGTEHQDTYTGKDGQKKYFDYIIANDIFANPISRYAKDSGKDTGTVGSDIVSDYIGDDEVPF